MKNISIPKELRETLPSPSYNVKHLKLSISQSFPRNEIDKLLDSLLWIFPLPDFLSMKFSYKSFLDFDQITLKVLNLLISYNVETCSLSFGWWLLRVLNSSLNKVLVVRHHSRYIYFFAARLLLICWILELVLVSYVIVKIFNVVYSFRSPHCMHNVSSKSVLQNFNI